MFEALLYGLPEGYRSADLAEERRRYGAGQLEVAEKAKDSDPEEPG